LVRVALGIEYDGSAYCGWQVQAQVRTVQGELERALSAVADHELRLIVAGRTDRGVHALMQVAHFDTVASRSARAWVLGANSRLPTDISVLWAQEVSQNFHARFSAQSRRYLYRILDRPIRPALDRQRVCWSRRPLDERSMRDAAEVLLGEHDFSAFRAAECQARTAVRRLISVGVARSGAVVEIDLRANAFLHHMVRNIAGSLLAVGTGDRPPEWLGEVLASRDRRRAGFTAPSAGLFFMGVEYPRAHELPGHASVQTAGPGCPTAGVSV
jgi:tRNA pseudouridine38-40 synthase